MKNKNVIFALVSIVIIIIIFITINEVIPIFKENEIKNRKFTEFENNISELEKSIIGIIPKSDNNEITSYIGMGSGVIFSRQGNKYYALTAYHVVDYENTTFKGFTRNTEFSGQTIQPDGKVNFYIPDEKYYESLFDVTIEYQSKTTDLAIVSFESDEELPVLEFETEEIKKGDKIICIGHPEGNRYVTSYGYIISDLKNSSYTTNIENKKVHDKVIEHDAYMNFGNSGGAAISQNMKIAGINVGGKFTLLKHYRKGYMIPYNIVEKEIQKWRHQ